MQARVKFGEGKQRKFLLDIELKSGLKCEELAAMAGVVGRSYRDWRRGQLNMSLGAAVLLSERFGVVLPEELGVLRRRWMEDKSFKGKLGGWACYRKHGSFATLEGRRAGGAKTLAILRERGIIPRAREFNFLRVRSAELAEFVGILLGDGGITQSQVCITLNSEADKEYLGFVVGLISRLFNFVPPFSKRKDCKANVIFCSGKKLVEYLVELGLKVGNKVKQQVGVPSWIEERHEYKMACVRGLMDTDGGVFVHKYKVNNKEYRYLKICFSNRSVPLLEFVTRVLENLDMTPKVISNTKNKQVWLYNQSEVERYLRVIGTHNPRLLRGQGGVR